MFCLLGLLILFAGNLLYAQDTSYPVTQDDVDDVASKMYCPICENEPLDACYNSTCIQWKKEIARQLELGRSSEEIIDDFVTRYGQHVVGVPQDPFLKGLSFFAPVVGTIIALIIAFVTFRRWQTQKPMKESTNKDPSSVDHDDSYRARIEQDLM
jgi:cytochrome c-type biogenesis protein CcmH